MFESAVNFPSAAIHPAWQALVRSAVTLYDAPVATSVEIKMFVFSGYGNRFETNFCRKYVVENPKQKVANPVNRDRVMHSR